jgi:type IV secretion system protein VirB9
VRRGRLAGCIVNQAFAGSGERLESGTVAPTVERVTTEPRP